MFICLYVLNPVEANIYKLTEKERKRMKIESLPSSLEEALWCMKNSLIARVALGKHIVDEFVTAKEIDSDWDALCKIYDEAIGKVEKPKTAHQQKVEDFKNAQQVEPVERASEPTTVTEPERVEEPKRGVLVYVS